MALAGGGPACGGVKLRSEPDLAAVRPRLLGMIDEARIATVVVPRPSEATVAAFLALTDLCSTVSDALDKLGVGGAVPGHILRPVVGGARICGPAITLRYEPVGGSVGARYSRNERPLLADRDLYAVASPGDVAVFDSGQAGVSVMGGLSARWAKRVGLAGCVVDGAVRDVATIDALAYPVWSTGVTPITGRHRLEAVEINGIVSVCGVQVRVGDLVIADETGVCAVPRDAIDAVLQACTASETAEATVISMLDEGRDVSEIIRILPMSEW